MAGPANSSQAGAVPITWTELASWSTMSAISVSPWESELLIGLSRMYCAQYNATVKDTPRPVAETDEDIIAKKRKLIAEMLGKI